MIDNTLENFSGWDEVDDYESDERSVTLLNEKKEPIAKFSYPRFTRQDFEYYKYGIE